MVSCGRNMRVKRCEIRTSGGKRLCDLEKRDGITYIVGKNGKSAVRIPLKTIIREAKALEAD